MIAHFRSTPTLLRPRASFTMVELLVVTIVIGLLASMIMFAAHGAMVSAQKARTRAQIARLDVIISDIWQRYETRRLPFLAYSTNPRDVAEFRVEKIRELMRTELPDRKTDVFDPPTPDRRSALSRAYLRRVNNVSSWTIEHQGAECLYMIVSMTHDGLRSPLEFFNENEVGDVDNDQMPEFLDAWGQPIEFLRWAPGFLSPRQPRDIDSSGKYVFPDAFDRLGLYENTYVLHPLIFSAGPDREYDIRTDHTPPNAPLRYSVTIPYNNNPYYMPSGGSQLGTPEDVAVPPDGEGNFRDNIHNHLLNTGIN